MDVQPDRSKNYGIIVGTLIFPAGNAGPVDGTLGSPKRLALKEACRKWVEDGIFPENGVRASA